MEITVKRVTIYPFHDEFIPVIKCLNKINPELEVCNVVTPMGFGINEKDAGEAYKKNSLGIKATNNLEEALSNSDILVITNGYRSAFIYEYIIKKMKKAIDMKVEIICTLELSTEDLNELRSLSQNNNVAFTYCNDPKNWLDNNSSSIIKMRKISAPVIYIGEVMDGFDGFEMLLKATAYLKEEGYNVLSIGKPKYSSIFNIEVIPDFIYQTGIQEGKKVYYFNDFIHKLEKEKNPDVIVIQLPGGLMKYNDIITNDFGIYPFIVSQAVRGDYFIYCTHYDRVNSKIFKMLSDTFKYRLGCEINAVNMTNKCLDASESIEESDILPFVWFEQSATDNAVKESNIDSVIPVYNCEKDDDCRRLFDNMIDTLVDYGQASNLF